MVEEGVERYLAKVGSSLPKASPVRRRKLDRRETVIFAAILLDLKGKAYCAFLHERQVRPKWSVRGGPATYPLSYELGSKSCKAVQDEKTRAKERMSRYPDNELTNAFVDFVGDKFHELTTLLQARNSRNSRHASSKPQMSAHA
jgi:hypothetical protein